MMMHTPRSSFPRRPARPLICVYSPLSRKRNSPPSHFTVLVKMTVLAGMLSPMANVSVANRHLTSCKETDDVQTTR